MATPLAGLKTMPTNVFKNEQIFNEDVTLLEALCYRGVVSRSLLDPSSITSPAPSNGTIYLVPDGSPNAVGEWATHGGSMAVYYDGWRYLPPDEGLTLWVTDEAQSIQFRSGAWINRNELAPTLLTDLSDVSLAGSPSPQDGESLTYNAALGLWMAGGGAASAVIGTIDFSVNNATTTEAAARQITGLSAYPRILITVVGIDPVDTDVLRGRLLKSGSGTGTSGVFYGLYGIQGTSTRYGITAGDNLNFNGTTGGQDNAHCSIIGHNSAAVPTVIELWGYDNDNTGTDQNWFSHYVTSADLDIFDGISFFTTSGSIIAGVATVYGLN